jgi:Toxin PAAR-like domain
MEVSCKAATGKTICAFPDTCFTPPLTPATPPGVPVPYPNTGMASDATDGSTSVKISGQEVMLKNKSYFKRSTGDEAGCAPKKGVVTSVNMGKVYFTMWSMDVKAEGENVVRFMDMTTHNHASLPANSPPWMYIDKPDVPNPGHPCHDEIVEAKKECKKTKMAKKPGRKKKVRDCSNTKCEKAMACILVPKTKDKEMCCYPKNTGHHLIQDNWISKNTGFPDYHSSRGGRGAPTKAQRKAGVKATNDAPTVCGNAKRKPGTMHRHMHNIQGIIEEMHKPGGAMANKPWDYGAGKDTVKKCYTDVPELKQGDCKWSCIESQLDKFYGSDDKRPLNKPGTEDLGADREPFRKKYTPKKKRR